jgi:nucleotide-binding universal stress UspA family protein
MTETILAGFVRSPEGEAAIDAAVEEVRRRGGRLVVVHSARGNEDADTVVQDRNALEKLLDRLRGQDVEVAVRDLARGNDPAEDLIQVAWEEQATLIVIGLRRRSPVGKLLLGSNAQEVLLRADCPVLAVKAAQG